jgi:hypothetical protein
VHPLADNFGYWREAAFRLNAGVGKMLPIAVTQV